MKIVKFISHWGMLITQQRDVISPSTMVIRKIQRQQMLVKKKIREKVISTLIEISVAIRKTIWSSLNKLELKIPCRSKLYYTVYIYTGNIYPRKWNQIIKEIKETPILLYGEVTIANKQNKHKYPSGHERTKKGYMQWTLFKHKSVIPFHVQQSG